MRIDDAKPPMTRDEFDEHVFKAIAKYGANRLGYIVQNVLDPCNGLPFLEAHHAVNRATLPLSERAVDRALQRLRKRGLISFDRMMGWKAQVSR